MALFPGGWPGFRSRAAGYFVIAGVSMSLLMGIMHQMVTRLRTVHNQLYKQHEWFRITLKSIGDAVIVTDRNGVVSFMNGEAERLTGWNSTEASQKPLRSVFRIINEESRKAVDDPVEKVFRERRVVGLANHTLLISKNGVEWPIEDSASPIHDQADAILGVVLVFHDATELRRNQRSLKAHADELEHKVFERTVTLQRTVNDLEAFSYSISHDLRSPLRAMLGYSQALLEDYPGMPKEATDYLQKIARSAERLDHLVEDLLVFSRVSHEDESIAPVDLDRLIRDIVQQYPNFQGDFDILIDGKLPVVLGHETALTQVVSNLLANAVKFVPRGIHRQRHRHRTGKPAAHLQDVRTDQSVGHLQRHRNWVGGREKSGRKMQGSLGVESSQGKGSKFWIELLKAKTP